jgi:general secretion pathway protein G
MGASLNCQDVVLSLHSIPGSSPKANRMIMCPSKSNTQGFTLIELMLVVAITATLAAIAYPMVQSYIDKARLVRAKQEIRTIEKEITVFVVENTAFPRDLGEIGLDGMLDPYGNPYQYLPVEGSKKCQLRKDHNLVPVNTDYDLYSMGKDGESKPPFTAKASYDDIVRANNGQYVGLVSGY